MASESVRPWFCRLVDAFPAPPLGAAAAIMVVLGAVEGLAFALNHRFSAAPLALDVRLLLFPAAIAYFVCAGWFVLEGWGRDVAALGPALQGAPESCGGLIRSLTHHARARLLVAAALGPLVPVAIDLVSPGSGGPIAPVLAGRSLGFEELYNLAAQILFWIVLLPVLYAASLGVYRLWHCGRREVRVDLLDPEALAPFARFGLRLALVVLAIPVLLLPASALGYQFARVEVLIYLPVMGLGIAALVLPSWGVHAAIREAKRAELARLRRAIRGDRAALAGSPLEGHAPELSFIELLAYRSEIRGLREWPFDASVLRRFGLYLLIPLGSWVAGALVERLVDALLE